MVKSNLVFSVLKAMLTLTPIFGAMNMAHADDVSDYASGYVVIVPAGLVATSPPEVDPAAIRMLEKNRALTKAGYETLEQTRDRKYRLAIKMLQSDSALIPEINRAAQLYNIDPIHIAGAIVGEHTFNVGRTDSIQTYIVNTAGWAGKWALRFSSAGYPLADLIDRPEFSKCRSFESRSHYQMWNCISNVWEASFRGRTLDGYNFPSASLRMAFFNPIASGFTYGIGQMDPLRALMVTDLVHEKSGLPLLTLDDPRKIYADIIDPFTTVHYMAANIRMMIDTYENIAQFDISLNPGITATLYNLGKEVTKAQQLKARNAKAVNNGALVYPQENFYGYFVNQHEAEIRQILRQSF